MAFDQHKNLAFSAVATPPSPATSGTSLTVTAGQGTNFPDPASGAYNLLVWPAGSQPTPANAEIIRASARAGDVLTITRAQEGTSARTIVATDQIALMISAKVITDIEGNFALYLPLTGGALTGLLDLSNAAAGQVKFPAAQNPSANVNTLDDYEEGSWTPVLGGVSGTSGQTYSIQSGSYVKVGKLVWATAVVALTAKGTITGNVQIQGLPFASENTSNLNASAQVSNVANLASSQSFLTGTLLPNTSAIFLQGMNAAVGTTNLGTSDISNTTTMTVTVVYRAAA